jgi:cytochrome oxidase Cu insertion factor (SCO1/SenC/PrrC family)
MSGSNSSAPASGENREALSFTVHSMPVPALDGDGDGRRTSNGRLKMLLVLLVCAAPVIASYFTYFVIRPQGRTNYSQLIEPQRPMPDDLALADPQGVRVPAASLKGQWLLVVVSGGACDGACEKKLWLQRQLREALGREKERVDKVWLVHDGLPPRTEPTQAVLAGGSAKVLSVQAAALSAWLEPAAGQRLEDHFYIVDPMGHWMMRVPPDADPAKLKRDLEKLLRGSASWDQPGR